MMYKIGEVFTLIRNGANIKQGEDDTGYPITRIETISNRVVDRNKMGYAGIHEIERYSDYILEDGDILMSHINSETHLGKVALYEEIPGETIIHGMNLLCLRPNRSILNCRYAFYSLMSDGFLRQIPRIMKKSVNQASFTVTALKELQIDVPPMEQQLQIVSVMDRIQSLLLQRQKQAAVIDQLVKSRFIELFGDPMTDVSKWSASTIGEQFNVSSGGTPATGEKAYWENGTIPWIGSNMCQDTMLSENDGKFITEEGYAHSSAKWFHKGTVLVALVGATIGKTALLRFDTTTNQNIAAIDVTQNAAFSSEFVFYHMQMLYSKFMEIGSGKFKMANQGFIRQLPLICPPIELQEQFATFVEQTDKSKLAVQKGLQELEILKKSLMQQYFG